MLFADTFMSFADNNIKLSEIETLESEYIQLKFNV